MTKVTAHVCNKVWASHSDKRLLSFPNLSFRLLIFEAQGKKETSKNRRVEPGLDCARVQFVHALESTNHQTFWFVLNPSTEWS